MKRLGEGAWADAQRAIGLTPDARGRPRGLLAFTEDDYRNGLEKFLGAAAAAGQAATFEGYGRWVENEERAGRRWPSAPAVRLRFTSWQQARRAIAGPGGGERSARSTGAPRLLAVTALHDAQAALVDLFERLGVDNTTGRIALMEVHVRASMQEFEHRRRQWLRESVLRDPTAARRQRDGATLSKRERDRLLAVGLDTFLTDMYLDRVGARDPRDTAQWLRPDAQVELDRVSDDVIKRFRVLREYRNLLTHGSEESRERLTIALADLAETDSLFVTNQPTTSRVLGGWLVAKEQQRLRALLTCMTELWRAMVVAEGLLQAEVSDAALGGSI